MMSPTSETHQRNISDSLVAIDAMKNTFILARESGALVQFSLSNLEIEATYSLPTLRIQSLQLNCLATKLALIDVNGFMKLLDLDFSLSPSKSLQDLSDTSKNNIIHQPGKFLEFDRKEVWDMKWYLSR